MNKQTYISIIEDADGNKIDFERWCQKKFTTVEKNVKLLYTQCCHSVDMYRNRGYNVAIYATPYRYDDYVFQKRLSFDSLFECKK